VLTSQHAYKIKRSVDVGECRHRSLQARHRACTDEYWLNQPLAPGVYMGVLPIARDALGGLYLNGKGETVEWVVKMRRLQNDRNLLRLVRKGDVAAHHITALAQTLANFYHSRPPKTDGYDDLAVRLERRVAEAAQQLKTILPAAYWESIQRVRAAQQRYLEAARPLLTSRVCDGRVVDGHGDLRPEHIFLERRPIVIDCIEYSAALRKLDALDDLCLLAMECERLDRHDIAAEIIGQYSRTTGDIGLSKLEAFYKSLHAMARGANALPSPAAGNGRSNGHEPTEAIACLRQARQYLPVFS
jgi:aminoglycoside phosphotransferase family enzyme